MRFQGACVAGLVLAVLLPACEDKQIHDLPFAEIRGAAENDAAGFVAYFDQVKGKRVNWQGKVVEARRVFEDDYAETGVLLIDMDAAGGGVRQEDVSFKIPPSRIGDFAPGQSVRFVAVLREYELKNGALRVIMEMKELE